MKCLPELAVAHVSKTVHHIMEDNFALRYVLTYSRTCKQRLMCRYGGDLHYKDRNCHVVYECKQF